MEIVSYVLSGELAHRDSMGNGTSIRPGEVQRMTAGTGVRHSEFNHAPQASTHFLQVWLLPDRAGHEPGYEQRDFPAAERQGRLRLAAAPSGSADAKGDGVIGLHADARLWIGLFDGDERTELALDASRKGYVFLARGELEVSGHSLRAGDALAIDGESALQLSKGVGAEVLVFDLAP
jgi:redox-sensitive bicupin YhaK (pirin superfamily)